MQQISQASQDILDSGVQTVAPSVNIEWVNGRTPDNTVVWANGDLYTRKTLELNPELWWRFNDPRAYETYIYNDEPIAYFPMHDSTTPTASQVGSDFEMVHHSPAVEIGSATGVNDLLGDAILYSGTNAAKYTQLERTLGDTNINDISGQLDIKYGKGFSIEAWIYPTSIPTDPAFYGIVTRSNNAERTDRYRRNWELKLQGNKLHMISVGEDKHMIFNLIATTSFLANHWYHIVFTWDGSSKACLYVNGFLEISRTVANAQIAKFNNNPQVIAVGHMRGIITTDSESNNTVNSKFQGRMQHLAFYNYGLAASTVFAHYGRAQSQLISDSSNGGLSGFADISNAPPSFGQAGPVLTSGASDVGSGGVWFNKDGGAYLFVNPENKTQASNNFAVEAWIYPTTTSFTKSVVVAKAASTGTRYYEIALVKNGSNIHTQANVWCGATKYTVDGQDIDIATWNHLVLQVSGDDLTLFTNMVVDTGTKSGDINGGSGLFTVGQIGISGGSVDGLGAYVSEVAFFRNAWFDEKVIVARYTSARWGLGTSGPTNRFAPKQIMNGQEQQTFRWALLDAQDENGLPLYPDGSCYVTEAHVDNASINTFTELEYGYSSKRRTDAGGNFGFAPENITIKFDAISVPYIKLTLPDIYAKIKSYTVLYQAIDDTWVIAAGPLDWIPSETSTLIELDGGNHVFIKGIQLLVYSTRYGNQVVHIQEICPFWEEDVSDDVVSMSIHEIKENTDTTIPLGITAANTCDLQLQNVDLKYNRHNTGSPVYKYMKPDIKIKVGLKPKVGANPPPVSTLGSNFLISYVNDTGRDVQFTDLSTGIPTSWAWTFGDSTTSTARNPSHTYTSDASFTVTLTVTDALGGTSSSSQTATVPHLSGPVAPSYGYGEGTYGAEMLDSDPIIETTRGSFMGFTQFPSKDPLNDNLGVAQNKSKIGWVRWGHEVPWSLDSNITYLSPSTGTTVTRKKNEVPVADRAYIDAHPNSFILDLNNLKADIALVRQYHGPGGDPMNVCVTLMGVPKWVNNHAGVADLTPNGNGKWHYYPIDAWGRTWMATFALQYAACLGPGDILEIFNEPNRGAFNHDGTGANSEPPATDGSHFAATPDQVGKAMAEVLSIVRAFYPNLTVMAGSLANYGDIGQNGDSVTADYPNSGPGFLQGMIAGDSRLIGSARPHYWGYHPYNGSADATTNQSAGYGIRQMGINGTQHTTGNLTYREVLEKNSVTKPNGDPFQISVTEYGTRDYQIEQGHTITDAERGTFQKHYTDAFDTFRTAGWVGGPEFIYTLIEDNEHIYTTSPPNTALSPGLEFEKASKRVITSSGGGGGVVPLVPLVNEIYGGIKGGPGSGVLTQSVIAPNTVITETTTFDALLATIDEEEVIPKGEFWVDTWNVGSDDMTANVACSDASRFAQDDENTRGYLARNVTAAQAVADMAKISGTPYSKIVIPEPYTDTILHENVVAYWPMRDSTGINKAMKPDLVDISGALIPEFYGTTNTMSFDMWVKIDTLSGGPYSLFSYIQPTTTFNGTTVGTRGINDIRLAINTSGRLVSGWNNVAATFGSGTAVTTGVWHHVAITFNLASGVSNIKAYLNGEYLGAQVGGTNAIADGGKFWFGCQDDGSGLPDIPLPGAIGDIRIHDHILSQIEIINLASQNILGLEDGITNSWDFANANAGIIYNQSRGYNNMYLFDNQAQIVDAEFKGMQDEINQCNGTYFNCTLGEPGPFNDIKSRSVLFNGSSSYAFVNRQDSRIVVGARLAVEAWFKPTTAKLQTIVAKQTIGATAPEDFLLRMNASNGLEVVRGSTVIATIPGLSLSNWYHVVVNIYKIDLTNYSIDIFLNGLKFVNGTDIGTADFRNSSSTWLIGRSSAGTYFAGNISNVAIYSDVITDDEVISHLKTGLATPPRIFPVAYSADNSLWDSMLNVATADLGMFNYDELGILRYTPAERFYDGVYPNETIIQYTMSDDHDIVSGDYQVELLANKVIVKVYAIQEPGIARQQIWSASDNESLAITNLSQDLIGPTGGLNSSLSLTMKQNTAGIFEPVFADSGFVKIGEEIIKFTAKDQSRLLNLERGMFGTKIAPHVAGETVTEVREYNFEWTEAPCYDVQRPFLTAEKFDGVAEIQDWRFDSKGGYARVVLNPRASVAAIYYVLEGTNPLTGLDNFFHVAGVPVKVDRAAQQITEVSETLDDQIRQHKVKSLVIDNEFVQGVQHATEIAKFLIQHFENPVPVIQVKTMGLPQLQLNDRISISNFSAMNIVDREYWITEIQIDYNGGIDQTLTLREAI